MKKICICALIVAVGIAVVPTADASLWRSIVPKKGAETPGDIGSIKPLTPAAPIPGAPASFHDLVEKVSPAVVNISTTKKVKVMPFNPFRNFGPHSGPNDPFDDFFDKFFEGMPDQHRQQHSLGSGFIFKPDGYILTNNHVVSNADEIVVRMSDEREYKARVIGRDEETDIAVIKVESDKPLPYVELGDSDKIRVGDWVVAIGNPFALTHTVTCGIVSAKGRVIGAGPYDNFIQTDASINPGNSGGPLFDMNGRVVGINTAIYAAGQGLGFAIPVDMAKKLLPQLIEHGKVMDRGWLGVMIQPITPELAKSFGLSEDQKGALVGDVVPDSPADKAGLKRGDLIVEFNGEPIDNSSKLPGMVATVPPGKAVKAEIIRNGNEESVEITLGKRESKQELADGEKGGPGADGADKLGLVTRRFSASEAHELGVDPARGVLVERVEPGSSAEYADVRSGDIIYEVNGTDINSREDYTNAVNKLEKGSVVRLLIRRNVGTIYLAFTLQ